MSDRAVVRFPSPEFVPNDGCFLCDYYWAHWDYWGHPLPQPVDEGTINDPRQLEMLFFRSLLGWCKHDGT